VKGQGFILIFSPKLEEDSWPRRPVPVAVCHRPAAQARHPQSAIRARLTQRGRNLGPQWLQIESLNAIRCIWALSPDAIARRSQIRARSNCRN